MEIKKERGGNMGPGTSVIYTFTSDFPAATGRVHRVVVSGVRAGNSPEALEHNARLFVGARASAGVTAERE